MSRAERLCPVVLYALPAWQRCKGCRRNALLSRQARRAARLSAQRAGLNTPLFEKDAAGTPLSADGNHWSISHKPRAVAGIQAPCAVGIDIEAIRPVSPRLWEKIATPAEWRQLASISFPLRFFYIWTAKEAVLKAVRAGLGGLSRCRLEAASDSARMRLRFDDDSWQVEHLRLKGHLAALAFPRGRPCWQVRFPGDGHGR